MVWEGAQSARPVSKSQGDGMTWVLSAAGSLSLNMKEVAQRIDQHGAAHVPGLPRAEGPGKRVSGRRVERKGERKRPWKCKE